jgi:L-iduronidase
LDLIKVATPTELRAFRAAGRVAAELPVGGGWAGAGAGDAGAAVGASPGNETIQTEGKTTLTSSQSPFVQLGLASQAAHAAVLNFTALDSALDQLTSLNLAVGFELMGNPGNAMDRSDRVFTDFTDSKQISLWQELVSTVAKRYIARFGATVVRKWRFESWNEPDGQCKRNLTVGITCDMPSFMQYFDACSAGLRTVDPDLIYGGPASDGTNKFLYGMLDHCINGTSTGGGECGRLDFVNVHKKGSNTSSLVTLQELPVAMDVQQLTVGTSLAHTPWGNDEADPIVSWSKNYPFRADSRYAAIVPKVIAQHQQEFIVKNKIVYDLLSNDNGFLPYPDNTDHVFMQRTLVARWMYNHSDPPTVETVRKPVLNTMALLAHLGDVIYPVVGLGDAMDSELGILATTRTATTTTTTTTTTPTASVVNDGAGVVTVGGNIESIIALVYNSADNRSGTATSTFNLTFEGAKSVLARFTNGDAVGGGGGALSDDAFLVGMFGIDEQTANSHTAWVGLGKPPTPNATELAYIRNAAEVTLTPGCPFPPTFDGDGSVTLPLTLALPAVHLVMICAKPTVLPAQVSGVLLHQTPTIHPMSQMMVKWNSVQPNAGGSSCIRTYIVLYSPTKTETPAPVRVNSKDTIFTLFLHAAPKVTGCYSVAAVDFWDQVGPASDPVCLFQGV